MLKSVFLTFSTITDPSTPALLDNWRKGASKAFSTILAANFSSSLPRLFINSVVLIAK